MMRTRNSLTIGGKVFTVAPAGTRQHGFDSPETRRIDRPQAVFLRPLHGRVRQHGYLFWAAVREAFGLAGSLFRSVNPHSSPSPFDSGVGGFSTANKEYCHV